VASLLFVYILAGASRVALAKYWNRCNFKNFTSFLKKVRHRIHYIVYIKAENKITLWWKSRPKKTIQMTNCKRFDNSCYHYQCIANWTAVQVRIGHSGEKRCKKWKTQRAVSVVTRSIRSHMTQLDTHRWWWRVMSWVRHEALLQVKNAWRLQRDVCIQLWFVFLNQ